MSQNQSIDPRDQAFLQVVQNVRERAGRQTLTDEDLAILACEEISRTTTREEQRYTS